MEQSEDKTPVVLTDEDYEYRKELSSLEHASQEKYDQAVMTLSGGALGISIAFVKDLVDLEHIVWLPCLWLAWLSWGFSVTSVLASFFFSQRALREAINQVDRGTHRSEPLGGSMARRKKFGVR